MGARASHLDSRLVLTSMIREARRVVPSDKKRAPDKLGARLRLSFGAHRLSAVRPLGLSFSCLPDPLQGPVNVCQPVMGNNRLDRTGKSRPYLLRRVRTPHYHSPGYTNPRPADGAGSSLP